MKFTNENKVTIHIHNVEDKMLLELEPNSHLMIVEYNDGLDGRRFIGLDVNTTDSNEYFEVVFNLRSPTNLIEALGIESEHVREVCGYFGIDYHANTTVHYGGNPNERTV